MVWLRHELHFESSERVKVAAGDNLQEVSETGCHHIK